jgi:hypothetical protein
MGRPPLLGRAPKQCRSRYLQQLVPGIKTGEWSVEEEEILVEGHKQFGNQWTLIASMLPGRTETSVKNHYNCTARRCVPVGAARLTDCSSSSGGGMSSLPAATYYVHAIGMVSLQVYAGMQPLQHADLSQHMLDAADWLAQQPMQAAAAWLSLRLMLNLPVRMCRWCCCRCVAVCRKVPSDPTRMTILQRYLAVIGVISPPGSKGSSSKYPSLGSGYPNSSSGIYFQATSTAAAAAAAAAAKAAGRRRGTSAPAAHSPSGSHMGYDEYDGSELAHAYSEADFNQAYAAYQAYQSMEQQQHLAAAAAAAAAMQEPTDAEGEDEVAEGAADGLLQLAHAAMLHLEEMETGDGDDEGAGSGSGEVQHCTKQDMDDDITDAAGEAYGDNGHQHQEEQDGKDAHIRQPEVAAAASKVGSKSPAGRHLPAWMKPELALSVMSSEESDRTAEEPDEGSPLAEQLLRQHLKSGSKRGSPTTATPARSQPGADAAPSKRPRSIWGSVDDAAGGEAGHPPAPRFNRPVLDVSEPEAASSCVPPPLSLPVDPSSPALPSTTSNSASMTDLNAHLVAMLMGAFMGAADSTAVSSPAAALPPDALAAIARVMATSMSSLQSMQQVPSPGAPTGAAQGAAALQQPASQLAAHGEA